MGVLKCAGDLVLLEAEGPFCQANANVLNVSVGRAFRRSQLRVVANPETLLARMSRVLQENKMCVRRGRVLLGRKSSVVVVTVK